MGLQRDSGIQLLQINSCDKKSGFLQITMNKKSDIDLAALNQMVNEAKAHYNVEEKRFQDRQTEVREEEERQREHERRRRERERLEREQKDKERGERYRRAKVEARKAELER